jgi:hypothetical protein
MYSSVSDVTQFVCHYRILRSFICIYCLAGSLVGWGGPTGDIVEFGIENGQIFFLYVATTITQDLSTPQFNDNQWHLVVVTVASNNLVTLYADGNVVGSGSFPSASLSVEFLTLGAVFDGDTNTYIDFYTGYMADFRTYNNEVTSAGVQSLLLDSIDGCVAYPCSGASVCNPTMTAPHFRTCDCNPTTITEWSSWSAWNHACGTALADRNREVCVHLQQSESHCNTVCNYVYESRPTVLSECATYVPTQPGNCPNAGLNQGSWGPWSSSCDLQVRSRSIAFCTPLANTLPHALVPLGDIIGNVNGSPYPYYSNPTTTTTATTNLDPCEALFCVPDVEYDIAYSFTGCTSQDATHTVTLHVTPIAHGGSPAP